ncbi:MAG: hypothetical protein MK212_18765 [Saprospiraceae bacterium]|nr:hypothetical protein [Saprospiraceae bacterium]
MSDSASNIKQLFKSDRAILILCIGIAFIFWLFTKLSYTYQSTISIPTQYTLPDKKILTEPAPEFIEVDISGTGWDLISTFMSRGNYQVDLDVNTAENTTRTISSLLLESKISRQLSSNLKIENIRPNNIILSLEDLAIKKIPVRLDENVTLAPLYQYKDSIRIYPQMIRVKGPASIVRDIHEWSTSTLIMQDVEQSFERNLPLRVHSNANVTFTPNVVICRGEVEETTEKRLKVPIEVVNAPDSLLLIILPRSIDISCVVGVSDYDRLRPNKFKAVVDFKQIVARKKEQSLKIEIRKKPSFISNFNFSPHRADYILQSIN